MIGEGAMAVLAILERLEERAVLLDLINKEKVALRAEIDRAIDAFEDGGAAKAYEILCAIAHRSPRNPGGGR